MKSRLFGALFDKPESDWAKAFVRDLADTVQLEEEDRQACLLMLPKMYLVHTAGERNRLLEQFAIDHQIDRGKAKHALGLMGFLLEKLLDDDLPDSDWQVWAEDLEDLNYLTTLSRPIFESMVAAIRSELLAEVEPEIRRRRAAAGVLPVFTGCGVTVEVRSVREAPYRRGAPIEEYEPQVVDTATVASVKIALDEGPCKEVYFQADESDMDYLINLLEAAKKDIAALRRFLKLQE